MTVIFKGREYSFRKCDTQNITREELQKMADTIGYLQYERDCAWLVVPTIGYGWEV